MSKTKIDENTISFIFCLLIWAGLSVVTFGWMVTDVLLRGSDLRYNQEECRRDYWPMALVSTLPIVQTLPVFIMLFADSNRVYKLHFSCDDDAKFHASPEGQRMIDSGAMTPEAVEYMETLR